MLTSCGSLYGQYGDGFIPYNVVIDPNGVLRYSDSGFNPAAMHQVIGTYLTIPTPSINADLTEICADDNGDGRPDPGETADLCITLSNNPVAVDASSVTVTLGCDDPDVTMLVAQQTWADGLDHGESMPAPAPFRFQVAPGAAPHQTTFTLQIESTYEGGIHSQELGWIQPLGRAPLLIVDGDGSSDDNETFLTEALDALDMDYELWDRPEAGSLPASEALHYSRLIWLGGAATLDLDAGSLEALAAFMDQGGLMLLSHQFFSDDPASVDFLEQYFGVQVNMPYMSNTFRAEGAASHPVFDPMELLLTGNEGANNNWSPDQLQELAGTEVLATWITGALGTAMTGRTVGASVRIFSGFPVEAMRTHSALPNSFDMTMFLQRVFEYELLQMTPPAAITDLAVELEGGMIRLNWSLDEQATSFLVYQSTSPYSFDEDAVLEVMVPEALLPIGPVSMFYQVRGRR